jgi:hypothetical protein
MKEPDEIYCARHSELSAYSAELRGLAFAIGDEELRKLANNLYPSNKSNSAMEKEMDVRNHSQHLHTRISELLQDTAH